MVDEFGWRKSTFSSGGNGNCVIAQPNNGCILLADSKRHPSEGGDVLAFSMGDIAGLVGGIKAGVI